MPAEAQTIGSRAVLTERIPVTLEDQLLGTFIDLLTNPEYAFSSEAGTFVDMFTLHFTDLNTGLAQTNGRDIRVYTNTKGINVWLGDENSGSVKIIDMTGRTVHSRNLNSNRTLIIDNAASGVYLVEVSTATDSVRK
ncbi:MAG: hypothetical protein ACI85F_000626 [Bacteroidia bacterium]|jgi:hypothetical protein